MVVRRIKDRVRERLQVTINEVGELDIWQHAELGCVVATGDRAKALEMIDAVVRVAVAVGGASVVAVAKGVITFADEPTPVAEIDDRTGSADKAQSAGGDDWIPEAWQKELE